ncbi:hypothetical protein ACFYWX_44790 [Streptomyces sp. NPDC002888]|uniref:hypothetical protein n=1 Tax=Streptomyces sp. NPDC002888 TaxID=3364668 RepID=UPI00369F3159
MIAAASGTAPIYDRLITERGDVIADVQRVAEQTRREAADVLDFGALDLDADDDGE